MTEEQKQYLKDLTEWQVWGMALKRGWSKEQTNRVISWKRLQNNHDQLSLVKEVFKGIIKEVK